MKTVIENATIIPMTGEKDVFTGDICINGSEIEYAGPRAPESCYPAEVIKGTGFAVLPSFVNAHTHISMVLMRNYKDGEKNLQDWLAQVWAIEDKLTAKDVKDASDLAIAEMIRSGITSFADMYFFQEETCKSASDAGVRASIGLTLFGDEKEIKRRFNERLPEILGFTDSGLIDVAIAPHAIYTVTPDAIRYASDACKDLGLRMHAHLSETKKEVEDCISSFGVTPAFHLEKLGLFKNPSFLAHCVHLTDDEISLLKEKETTLVHCPSSNSKLASGICPVKKYRQAGLNMAFGTDGASSNNSLNMMKEINLGAMLASASTGDTQALRPYDALEMATLGGARALGLDDRIGTLEKGKKADFIMVDLKTTANTPVNNLYSALVYSSTSEDIKNVFCNGEMLMKNRHLLTLDERKTIRNVNRSWADLQSR